MLKKNNNKYLVFYDLLTTTQLGDSKNINVTQPRIFFFLLPWLLLFLPSGNSSFSYVCNWNRSMLADCGGHVVLMASVKSVVYFNSWWWHDLTTYILRQFVLSICIIIMYHLELTTKFAALLFIIQSLNEIRGSLTR
jgi:hypothetical protein